jgi:5-methyltetrahydropteroyltriglutamate--homocysteine methyltransferase
LQFCDIISDRCINLILFPFTTKVRRTKQLKGVPLLPTTTIGSFPQTPEVRRLRTQLKKNTITKEEYDAAIDKQIAYAIGIQEALGLDIFVHGEAERTDMVEFFAQNMDGMLFSTNGWVQSFGSRCVRPPIFWSDISRSRAMTTREFAVAQSLTNKPVKGMLTGPVTILNWSFPRIDVSRETQAMQIGLAIRDEIADLEKVVSISNSIQLRSLQLHIVQNLTYVVVSQGCTVVQVDEPALREAMPLREAKKEEYLRWTVDAFRLSTAGAKNDTQVHTHMCYCEFDDCMEAIDRMDTDVNSIENARNDNYTLRAFKRIGYSKGLGPGTYDIHSPVVPSVQFIKDKIKSFLPCVEIQHLCINPDCGLKTRTWPETIGALKNMVAANDEVRTELGLPTSMSTFKSASLGQQAKKA